MNGFWNGWIISLTALNIAAALWLLWTTSRKKPGEKGPGEDTTGHTWDGDLAEYNNPLPRWWLWGFYFTVAFALVYLAFYPGLGNFAGRLGWTQEGAVAADIAAAAKETNQRLERYGLLAVADLRHDEDAMRTARNLFAANCAACHGTDAHGARGFPNLTDQDWLHGGDEATILTTLRAGRTGVMPAWEPVLGAAGIEQVTNYVLKLSNQGGDAALAAAGSEKFAQLCAACHGPDGRGTLALGAPNLTDTTWLYGGSAETIRETLIKGRTNQMPAHLDLLGETRLKLLTAYVMNLSAAPTGQEDGHHEEHKNDDAH